MDHDVKAVANVFYKLAREDKRYLTNLEYQQSLCVAQDLCVKVLGEPLFDAQWKERPVGRVVPEIYDSLPANAFVRSRWQTSTRPITVESPAWKVIRAAYLETDYKWRHGQAASDTRDNNATPPRAGV